MSSLRLYVTLMMTRAALTNVRECGGAARFKKAADAMNPPIMYSGLTLQQCRGNGARSYFKASSETRRCRAIFREEWGIFRVCVCVCVWQVEGMI